MKIMEIIAELKTNQVLDTPHERAWEVERKPGLPSSGVQIEREGDKVRVYATVNDQYKRDDDAEAAPDVVPLLRTWARVVIEELPKFVRDTDTSIKIEAHGKRAGVYARAMPQILDALQSVNTGWVYNKPWVNPRGGTLFTFSNYNYDKDRGAANWSDKRAVKPQP